MSKLSYKVAHFLEKQNPLTTVSIFVITNLFITSFFVYYLKPNDKSGLEITSLIEELILIIILVPIIETYIFQHLLITYARRLIKNPYFEILVSAILFGAIHNYSIGYILKGFLAGLLYASEYLIFEKKNQKPILYVAITHSVYNIMVSIINRVF